MNPVANPYVGPRTFEKSERDRFFGREREERELLALTVSEQLILFYAQSGAGKSSLINACLIPDLEQKGFRVLPIGRVGGDAPPDLDVENIYVFNLISKLAPSNVDVTSLAKLSLCEFLSERKYVPSSESSERTNERIVLIIDQFEELFSTHPEEWESRQKFFIQLAETMEQLPNLWVVLVMREDYIAPLEPYEHLLPGRLRVRYYMQRLNRDAAIKAIRNPVEMSRPYAPGVAERLVKNLATIKVQRRNGKQNDEPLLGQFVEPVQLQVVCHSLWENLSKGTEITEKDLAEVGDVDLALEKYYEARVRKVAEQENVSQRLIREWFEKQLITSSGTRNLVLQNQETGNLSDEVIQRLQGDLVRAEMRSGQIWYELSHDRLIEPVQKNNKAWFEKNLSGFQRQAEAWIKHDRSPDLLLRGKELEKAEEEIESLVLNKEEEAFINECRKLRDDEQREVRQRRRLRIAFFISAFLLLVATAFAAYAINASKAIRELLVQAQNNESAALALRNAAQDAQKQAEAAQKAEQQAAEAAKEAADKALAGNLAAQANSNKNINHGLALLMGLEAYTRNPNDILTRSTLFQLLQFSPYRQLPGFGGPVSSVAISPDGTVIAAASCIAQTGKQCGNLGEITLLNPDLSLIGKLPTGGVGRVYSMAFHEIDGKLILATSGCVPEQSGCITDKGEITLWNVTDHAAPIMLQRFGDRDAHTALVKTIAFTDRPEGTFLASGSYDTTILLWNVSNPANVDRVKGKLGDLDSFVNSIAFSGDGKFLAAAGDDGKVSIWDVANLTSIGQRVSNLQAHNAPVNSIMFSPALPSDSGCSSFATGSDDNSVVLWDWCPKSISVDNHFGFTLKGHTGYVKSIAFNSDGSVLASAGFDNKVILWDTKSGEQIGLPLAVHSKSINEVMFGAVSDNEKKVYLLSASDDRTLIQWDLSTHNPLSRILVSVPAGEPITSTKTYDARLDQQEIDLKNKATAESKPLAGHITKINSISFNPLPIDGKQLLASGGDDQAVILHDVTDFSDVTKVFLKLEGFNSPIQKVYFDGTQLITIDSNGQIIAWILDPSVWKDMACSSIKSYITPENYRIFRKNFRGAPKESCLTDAEFGYSEPASP